MKALTLYLCVKSPQDGSFLPESTAKKLLKYEKVREKKLWNRIVVKIRIEGNEYCPELVAIGVSQLSCLTQQKHHLLELARSKIESKLQHPSRKWFLTSLEITISKLSKSLLLNRRHYWQKFQHYQTRIGHWRVLSFKTPMWLKPLKSKTIYLSLI